MKAKKLFNDVSLDTYPKTAIKNCFLYLLAQNNKAVYFKLCQRSKKTKHIKDNIILIFLNGNIKT